MEIKYDIALILREKGFDVKCSSKYTKDNDQKIWWYSTPEKGFDILSNKRRYGNDINYNTAFYFEEGTISAPTINQVIKWFIDKHKLHLWVDCGTEDEWIWTINRIKKRDYIQSDEHGIEIVYKSYDEAIEQVIIKALSLI